MQVAGLVGRADVLAALFYLGTLLIYRRAVLAKGMEGMQKHCLIHTTENPFKMNLYNTPTGGVVGKKKKN